MTLADQFFKAVESNACEECITMMSKPIDISQRNVFGWTSLHLAAIQGHFEMIHLLIDQGGDVNLSDHYGWSPLMFAVICQNNDIVKLLLQKGANPHVCNQFGMKAIDLAETLKNEGGIQLLRSFSDKQAIPLTQNKQKQRRLTLKQYFSQSDSNGHCRQNAVITKKTWVYLLCEWFKQHPLSIS